MNNKAEEIIEIGQRMWKQNLSIGFVGFAIIFASKYEGIYDLMKLWDEEVNQNEKNNIISDIDDMIDECRGIL